MSEPSLHYRFSTCRMPPLSPNNGSMASLPSSASAIRPSTSGINNTNHPSTGSSSGFMSIAAGNANHISPSPMSSDYILSQVDIADFLSGLHLNQFTADFQAKNRFNVLDLTRLTVVDFSSMGISVADQKRIRDAVDNLRRQFYAGSGATLPRRSYGPNERPGMAPPPPPPPLMASASLSRRIQASKNAKDGYFV